jgi:hypothetical protein
MLCGGLLLRAFFLAAICALTFPTLARAAFEIVSHDAVADAVNRQTTFHLTFNQSPDFFTTDEFGHPTNGFQFFYDAQPIDDQIDFAGEDVVIIRGVEIRVADDIPIRDSLNPSGEEFPNAEGWGPKRGAADFELDGAMLSFTTSWDTLNESDGVFGYRLFALEQGDLTSEVTFLSRILVPLPLPVILGGVGLLLSACTACTSNRRI